MAHEEMGGPKRIAMWAALKIRRGRGRSRGQGDLDDEDEHGRERDNETERASADEPVGGAAGGERTEGGIQAACRRDRVFPRPHGHASIRRSSIDRAGYHRVVGCSSCPWARPWMYKFERSSRPLLTQVCLQQSPIYYRFRDVHLRERGSRLCTTRKRSSWQNTHLFIFSARTASLSLCRMLHAML